MNAAHSVCTTRICKSSCCTTGVSNLFCWRWPSTKQKNLLQHSIMSSRAFAICSRLHTRQHWKWVCRSFGWDRWDLQTWFGLLCASSFFWAWGRLYSHSSHENGDLCTVCTEEGMRDSRTKERPWGLALLALQFWQISWKAGNSCTSSWALIK